MPGYIGLQGQIARNNTKSVFLLIAFPALILGLTWLFFFLVNHYLAERYDIREVNKNFLNVVPLVATGVLLWFFIAYFSHSSLIRRATGSQSLERKENKRVYNLVENLCISQGMAAPKINIIEDESLNAFASGINKQSYAVSFSRGIINKLNDEELEGVIAHELTHIKNRDVRLLIISIIFVGIFAFVSEWAFRSLRHTNKGKRKDGGKIALILLVVGLIGYFLSILCRFALSRKREYLADAGAAQMTRKPLALASALKKISSDPRIEAVKRKDIAQMFIENPQETKKSSFALFFSGIFATHPPIEERIRILEQI